MFSGLPRRLLNVLSRTMVLELNVARLQGLLNGDTPEKRFRSFLELLRQMDKALAIFEEYPVLARQLTICMNNWVDFSFEFLQHLCIDWEAIKTLFSQEQDPGLLAALSGAMGDRHRGGRSVMIATFSSGLQVVYKPKSLAVEGHFQELLTWLNGRGDHPPFLTLKILDRGSHGWVEFVASRPCTCEEEVRRFYERQGGYLALLYALEARDFHFENLIASGEHPVLVDLEALFHPRHDGSDEKHADEIACRMLVNSVLSVGLLPWRLPSSDGAKEAELSGLGGAPGQVLPFWVRQWEDANTDTMRFTRQQAVMLGGRNRPSLDGTAVNALDFTEAIVSGFSSMYRLLLRHRSELLAHSGSLARFAADEVRVILRPTRTYSLLLHESYHPDLLRNALDRDRFFDTLWIEAEYRPYLARVIPAEREDLQRGDIPMFTTRPGSRHLWTSVEGKVADFLEESGLARVQRRLGQFSETDLNKQLWFVRASLATLALREDEPKWPSYTPVEPRTSAKPQRLLEAASAVGNHLEMLALRGKDDVSWLGLKLTSKRHWSLVPLESDLYAGIPGVLLFLAYLGAVTGEERYTSLARAALATLRRQVEHTRPYLTSIGAFDGWGGIIYCLTHLGLLWKDPGLLEEAEEIVKLLPDLIEKDNRLDVIGGAAGCIGSLVSLYHCAPTDRTLAAAVQCGDRLIRQAQATKHGIGWVTDIPASGPLTGFSHGAAGMAWALMELATRTGQEQFRTAALEAVEYERSVFSPEAGNWPDLRKFEGSELEGNDASPSFATAWCHGAPGIGLARLRSLRHGADVRTLEEVEVALETTLARGFRCNHSLCHGDLGNLELLLQASQVLDEPQWRPQVDRLATMILESISQHGWLCGIPLGVESPGLMTGLAGIGYELLRLAEPTRVPSVLVLEPPLLQA